MFKYENLKKIHPKYYLLVADIPIIIMTYIVSLILVFGFDDVVGSKINEWKFVLIILPIKIYFFATFGLYRNVLRHMDLTSIVTIFKTTVFASFVIAGVFSLFKNNIAGRTIIVDWMLTFMFVSGTRYSTRLLREVILNNFISPNVSKNCVIYGKGELVDKVLRHIRTSPDLNYRVRSVFSSNHHDHNKVMQGINMYYDDGLTFKEYLKENKTDLLIIADNSLPRQKLREILFESNEHKIEVKIVPMADQFLKDATLHFETVRDVSLEDLLKRDKNDINLPVIEEFIKGKIILVSGAGGSIGSEMCNQILECKPKKLILLEKSEFNLYQIERQCLEKIGNLNNSIVIVPLLLNVTDKENVFYYIDKYKPNIVIHAAAYKHVPMVEKNIALSVKNNVLGTKILADACVESKVEKFILVSSDKAVNPTNVMGTTKRLCEIYIQSLHQLGVFTKFSAVRFGNVLGSSGSVIPLFKEQILKGGPITVTHPDITRYFMLIPEAVQLVLQAGSLSEGGEIFILDMGEPVKILNLAKDMITLSGLKYPDDIDIIFTGLRPGEKLYEELIITGSEIHTQYESIFIAQPKEINCQQTFSKFKEIFNVLNDRDDIKIIELMNQLVPEFKHKRDNSEAASSRMPSFEYKGSI